MPDIAIVYDYIVIEEFAECAYSFYLIDEFEIIATIDSFEYAPYEFPIVRFETIAVLLDVVDLAFTPYYVNVVENAVVVTDYAYPPDLSESGISVENIVVTENVTMNKEMSINEFWRGYPFVEIVQTGIIVTEFDNGVIQQRDTWGRTRRRFEINFPPMTKAQAMDVKEFYEQERGNTFSFTNPLDEIAYTVRIVDESFILTRRYFAIYYATMILEEVF